MLAHTLGNTLRRFTHDFEIPNHGILRLGVLDERRPPVPRVFDDALTAFEHVFDIDGKPIVGLGVHLEGELNGDTVELDTLTGSASEILGGSGYLFDLANEPIASEDTLWLQLMDVTQETPLSDQIFLTTYNSCESNLILVNFRKIE